jgi:uncharacterized protein (TIGR01777 family)
MKILISGASGLVGTALSAFLLKKGHELSFLRRKKINLNSNEIFWDPLNNQIDDAKLKIYDSVIHLSGENITAKRWSASFKKELLDSRVKTTKFLVDVLKQKPPKTFLCASAIGIYGDRKNETLTELSNPGIGFLPEICEAWENEANRANAFSRVILGRIGIVISKQGGALKKMLTPFRLGLGGVVGSGEQFMSWISINDLISAFEFCLKTEAISGAVNLVSPNPLTNRDFTQALAKQLARPAFFPIPEFMIKLIFGEMGQTLLLGSTKVAPEKLSKNGFLFKEETLAKALKRELDP